MLPTSEIRMVLRIIHQMDQRSQLALFRPAETSNKYARVKHSLRNALLDVPMISKRQV